MTTPISTLADTVAGTAADTIDRTRSTVEGLADDARDLTQRGVNALRDGTRALREETAHLADSTVGYIKDEPIKSVLIAAAAGAALMALATHARRSFGSRD